MQWSARTTLHTDPTSGQCSAAANMINSEDDSATTADPPVHCRTGTGWWLYLLACADGRTYAGITTNVWTRFKLHAQGKGAKFTRANPPVAILGATLFTTKSAALQAEHALKQLSKAEKMAWARQWPVDESPHAPSL